MEEQSITYNSSNSLHDIHAKIFLKENIQHKAIVQIVYGMGEYIERYRTFITFLVEEGFIVCINDHAGHGDSIGEIEGFIAHEDGDKVLLQDVHNLYLIMKTEYENLPYFLLGHSLGSLVARSYAIDYGEIDGLLLSGTGVKDNLSNIGLKLSKILIKIKGATHTDNIFKKFTFERYNNHFKKLGGTWLTKDLNEIEKLKKDKKFLKKYTYSLFRDALTLLVEVSDDKWYNSFPKDLPVYLFAGTDDYFGNFGKGVKEVYNKLQTNNVTDVTLKLYDKGRHEMINETNKEEVFNNILIWLKERQLDR